MYQPLKGKAYKKLKDIKLKDGWNPEFGDNDTVIATRPFYTIEVGDVLEYNGGCDHPEFGWVVFLKDSGLTIPGYEFEQRFRQIIE